MKAESNIDLSAHKNPHDNSLNILFVFGCRLMTGGHIKSALAMIKNLEQMGHHVFVMAVPGGNKEIENEFTAAGAECIFARELGRYWKFPTISGYRKIAQICRDKAIDVIHAQDVCSTGRSYLASAVLKKPFVFTQPGGPLTHHIPPADCNIVLFSEELVQRFESIRRIKKNRIHLIRARIDTTVYKISTVDSQFVDKYSLPKSGIKIVMALRLIPQKSALIGTMLEAVEKTIEKNKDVHFIIAGEGSLLNSLRNRAIIINEVAGYPDAVKFTGNIESAQDMNSLYNYADIIFGHGRGILEAMACGKPVIILGENGEGETVRRENIEEIAFYNFSGRHFHNRRINSPQLPTVIEYLLKNPDERFELGKFASDFIREKMDARLGATELLEVYNQSIKSHSLDWFSFLSWYIRASIAVIAEGFKRLLNF